SWFKKRPPTTDHRPPTTKDRGLKIEDSNVSKDDTLSSIPYPRSSDTPSVVGRRSSVVGRRQVVYFHGCSTNYYEPHVGIAVVEVLERNGFEVILPKQNCCGLPMLSNGDFDSARRYHEHNIAALLPYVQQGIPVVGTSTSCTLTFK